jgi:hypothetical protein
MITMLYIMVIGVLVTTGAVYALYSNTAVATVDESSTLAYTFAENGIENALLRLIRDPEYIGETLVFGNHRNVEISVTGGSPQFVTAVGYSGNASRVLQVSVQYVGGDLVVDSWKEIP